MLIPAPRSVVRTGRGLPPVALDRVRTEINVGVPEGAYHLSVTAEGVRISAGDKRGLQDARATLAQLRNAARVFDLPEAMVKDAPSISGRGLMLDISRCRVPRTDELRSVLPVLAGLKLNHLQLYTEHTFAYAQHDDVWRGSSPLTPCELSELARAAATRGIDLAPNQNCFGHLSSWLRHPRYAHLAETHGEWSFAGMPRSGPFSLCPVDPRSLTLISDLLDQLLACLSGELVNIGCDETYDVGTGRSRTAVEARGKAAVYADFVSSVCQLVTAHGRTPMFWSDIAEAHPDVLAQIPREAVALVWGYEPTTNFGAQGRLHAAAGRRWWACPGTSSWRSFTGRSFERRANIRRAARDAVAQGAAGLLACDWGDVGHRQVWPVSLLGIAEAADAAWTGRARAEHFLDAVSLQVFGDATGATARWLEELGDADEPIRATAGRPDEDGSPTRLSNATALFTELHPPPTRLGLPRETGPWKETLDRLEDLASCVPSGGGPLVEDELRHAVQCATFAARIAILRRGGGGGLDTLSRSRDRIVRTHRRLWHVRSRRGGLDESTRHWTNIEIGGGR